MCSIKREINSPYWEGLFRLTSLVCLRHPHGVTVFIYKLLQSPVGNRTSYHHKGVPFPSASRMLRRPYSVKMVVVTGLEPVKPGGVTFTASWNCRYPTLPKYLRFPSMEYNLFIRIGSSFLFRKVIDNHL